jgi:hypothetical protein
MTAVNLGARVTGWGFVVFLIGSISWSLIGFSSGQTNLLWTNGFLTVVNLVGIWRWLGRQARYQDGGRRAVEASEASPAPTLLTASAIADMPVDDSAGDAVGTAVEALLECDSGRLASIIMRRGGVGGIGERLIRIERNHLRFDSGRIALSLSAHTLNGLPDWVPEASSVPNAKQQ